jgi:hypothetical protein
MTRACNLKVRHLRKSPPPTIGRRSQFQLNSLLRRQGLVAVTPYLEQSLSPILQEALLAFAMDGRPLHPRLSETQSALMYIALFLKARNRASPELDRVGWHQKLESFLLECKPSVPKDSRSPTSEAVAAAGTQLASATSTSARST